MTTQKILMISDDFLPAITGVGIHLKVITQELVKKGHEVVLITARKNGLPSYEKWNGVHVYRVFSVKIAGFYQALTTQKQIRNIIQKHQINIIHQHYMSLLMLTASTVARQMNLPEVYTYHMSPDLLTQPLFMRPFRSLINALAIYQLKKFNLIIFPSSNMAQKVFDSGVQVPSEVISNPIAFNKIQTIIPIDKKSSFHILYVGRLAQEKNIPYLLNAFKEFAQGKMNRYLWLIGNGPERAKLMELAHKLNIENQIEFLGYLPQSEIARYYSSCDVFVLPSRQEVQSLVTLEAMHFSKPVILTKDIISAPELVDVNQNGFIVDAESPSELAARLELLEKSPELRIKMGNHSKQKSLFFSTEEVIKKLESVYQSVSGSCHR